MSVSYTLGCFALVVCLTYLEVAQASHFRGGIISWKPTGNGNQIEITWRMSWRRSSVYCDSDTIQNRHLVGTGNLYRRQYNQAICNLLFYCTDYSVTDDWTTGVNTYIYDSSLTSFDMYFSGCCWIPLNNGGGSWSLEASVNLTRREDTGVINSSPITAMSPIVRAQYGCSYNLNIPTSDADGDEVRCRWPATSYEGDEISPPMGMELNKKACTLSYYANSIGWHGVAVVIEDFATSSSTTPLSKIPLQFLIHVTSSSDPCSSKPELVDPSPEDGDIMHIWHDQTFTAMIRTRSSSSSVPVNELETVSPQGMTRSPLQPVFDSPTEVYSIITWVPQVSQEGPHIFCFSVRDLHGHASDQRCITLVVCASGPSFDVSSSYPAAGSVIYSVPNLWEAGFDDEFFLPNTTAYIRICDLYYNEIHTIDTATSPNVFDNLKYATLSFTTPGINMTYGEYHILLDEGVVIGTDQCLANSTALTDRSVWRFTYVLKCDSVLTSAPGTIASPGYPSKYPNEADCEILIRAGVGQRVFLKFNAFRLENCCDILNIYDGDGPEDRLIGSYQGTNMPPPITSTGRELFIWFESDLSVTFSGFEAEYSFINDKSTPQPWPPWTTVHRWPTTPRPRSSKNPNPTDNPSADMTCADNTMTVYVPRSVIGTVDADNLHFVERSCVGTDHNSTHVRLVTAFDECGTVMEVEDDYVVFSNIVIDDALPVTPGKVITRDKDLEIPVECHMERDGFGSISFHPDTSKIIFREDGYGKFSFQLQLYPDQYYNTPYPPAAYPIDVNLRDMLYFEAQVSAEPGLELFVETCVATTTANPYSSPQYYFLQDGCSKDNTLQFYSSSDPMVERFGLEAFAFVGRHTPVYAHCFLMLCNVTDPTSRCALGCQPFINKRDVSMREATSGSRSYVMSKGPMNFIENDKPQVQYNDNIKADDISGQLGFLVGAVGFITLCLLVTVGVVFKSRQSTSDGYMRVATEE